MTETSRKLSLLEENLQAAEKLLRMCFALMRPQVMANGKVSLAAMDEHQVLFFDLAYLSTLLFSAKQMVGYGKKGGDLEKELALFFIGEALEQMLSFFARSKLAQQMGKALDDLVNRKELTALFQQLRQPAGFSQLADGFKQHGFGDYQLSEDHKMMKQTFEKYGREKIAPQAEKIHREDLLVPEELIKELAEMGCFGLTIPEKYGGFMGEQPDNVGMVVITEELSRASLGAAGSLITRPEILSKAILKGGTEEQKKKWLPLVASGEKMVAVAVTEPDFGSDVASITCQALPKEGGFLINGVKTWCTFAGRADILLLLARSDPDPEKKHKGLSLFVVEKERSFDHTFAFVQESGGKISGRAIPTIGYRGMHSYEVVFENYFVPEENLIGGKEGEGKGFYLQMEGFAGGRLQTAARATGVMQAALDRAFQYAQERKVFGKPIFEYRLTQFKLARMAATVQAARQASYAAARQADQGKGQLESSMVKLFASRASEWVTREAMQIHGGMGYAEEYDVSRYFVDARVFSIFEGAEEILALRVISRKLLEQESF